MPSIPREKLLLALALLAAGLFLFDRFLFTPALNWRSELSDQQAALESESSHADALLRLRPTLERRWRDMRQSNLQTTRSEAEGQIYGAVQSWAQQANLDLQLISPQRVIDRSTVPQVVFRVGAVGDMRAMSRFFEQMQQADFPIQASMVQLTTRKDGADDLTLEMQISTLFLPVRADASPAPAPEMKETDELGESS